MNTQEAKQILRRVNELYYELHPEQLTDEDKRQMQEEIDAKLKLLRENDFPATLIHADILTSCGRYVLIDAIAQ